MKYFLALLALFSTAAFAQTANVSASASYTIAQPTKFTDGSAIPPGALVKTQFWVKTLPIADTDTSAPTAEQASGTVTNFTYTGTIPNGSTLYFRSKACTATVCSDFANQLNKQVTILIPSAPVGVSVSVTVTLTTGP